MFQASLDHSRRTILRKFKILAWWIDMFETDESNDITFVLFLWLSILWQVFYDCNFMTATYNNRTIHLCIKFLNFRPICLLSRNYEIAFVVIIANFDYDCFQPLLPVTVTVTNCDYDHFYLWLLMTAKNFAGDVKKPTHTMRMLVVEGAHQQCLRIG